MKESRPCCSWPRRRLHEGDGAVLSLVQATAVEELRRGVAVEELRRGAAVEELRRGAAVEGLHGLQECGVTTVAEVVYSVTGKT
jgi:hypothetical protein